MVKIKSCFEIIDVAEEYMAIPVGEEAKEYSGIVTLSETAAFLLQKMKEPISPEELARILTKEYEIEIEQASIEVSKALELFGNLELLDSYTP